MSQIDADGNVRRRPTPPPAELPSVAVLVFLGLAAMSMATSKAGGRELFLQNAEVRFAISSKTGAIVGGWNPLSQDRYLGRCADRYKLESLTAKKDSEESKDSVLEYSFAMGGDPTAQRLILFCRNTDLDLSIVKKYTLAHTGNKLIKEVTFSGPEDGLFTYIGGVTLQPSFRRRGYYHKLVFHSEQRPVYRAAEVTGDLPVGKANVAQVCFVSPAKDYGVGHYRYRVNGRYVFVFSGIDEKQQVHYTARGWQLPLFQDFLRKGYSPTVQAVYTIFRGDQLAFHRQYMELPEFNRIDCTDTSPPWVKYIKLYNGWDVPGFDRSFELVANLADKCARGYPGYILNIGWEYYPWYGDFSSADEEVKDQPAKVKGGRPLVLPSTVKKCIEKFHGLGRWVKCGQYTNPGLVSFQSLTYKDHPDWAVFGKNGKPVPGVGAYSPATIRQLSSPAGPAYVRQIADMMENFNLDFAYIDGGGSGIGIPDWKRKIVNQDYEAYDLWKDALYAVRARRGAIHHNMPFGLYSDSGFWESEWQGQYAEDWRIIADRLLFTKLYQVNHRPILICSRHTDARMRQVLINYWIALGYTPTLEREPAWLLPLMPYVNTAYELRFTRLVDAHLSPCWWKQDTDIETYALQQGPARLIALISHASEKRRVTVSAGRDRLGLRPDRKTMSWLIAPRDSRTVDFSQVTGDSPIDHLVDNQLIRIDDSLPERLEYTVELVPEVVRIIMITQSPGLLYAVNGERTQCLLPEAARVGITGSYDEIERTAKVRVNSKAADPEVLILVPKSWGAIRSADYTGWGNGTLERGKLQYDTVHISGRRFLKIKVSWLQSEYEIHTKPVGAAETTAVRFKGIEESFSRDRVDGTRWKLVPSRSGGTLKVVDGKLYLRGVGQHGVGIATRTRIGGTDEYTMEYDFYPVAAEARGWGIGADHPRPEGGRYWGVGWSGGKFWLNSFSKGTHHDQASEAGLPADTWYHVTVTNRRSRASVKIVRTDTGKQVADVQLPHDPGTRSRIQLFAAYGSSPGVIGGYFDNIKIAAPTTRPAPGAEPRAKPTTSNESPRAASLFEFVQVSDPHIEPSRSGNVARFKQAVREINAIGPAFVLITGDLTESKPEDYVLFKKLLADLHCPAYLVPGNHDVAPNDKYNSVDAEPSLLERYQSFCGQNNYSFDHRGGHFIGLDSQILNSRDEKRVGDLLSWLKKDLKSARRSKHIFLFFHIPLYDYAGSPNQPDSYWNIQAPVRRQLLDLLEQHRVTACFSGHLHRNRERQLGATRLFATASTSSNLADGDSAAAPQGYRVIRVFDNRITTEYVPLGTGNGT